MSQFQLSLVSANSRFDKFITGEVEFTKQELQGYELFKSHCNACHTAPLFTNLEFENNGLEPDSVYKDWGKYKITNMPEDSLKFKVPSLRNLAYTKPYMHDGRFNSIRQVLNHYESGIQTSTTLNALLDGGILLSDDEKTDLTAFLKTLNDKEFVFNPSNQFPQELKNQLLK